MPTVIDSLVVKLGFDTTALKSGRAEAGEQLRQTRSEAGRAASAMESEGARAAQFFTQIKTEALSLLGVFLGERSLASFVESTTTSLAALGRDAKNIGIAVPELAAFRNMIERNGGSADAATQSFRQLTDEMERFKVYGQSSMIPFLNPIGGQRGDSAMEIYKKFVAFAEQHQRDVPLINLIGHGLGLDQGSINQAMKGTRQVNADLARSYELGVPNKEMTQSFQKLQEGMIGLQQAMNNLATILLDKIAPGLAEASKNMATWVSRLPKTAEEIADAIKKQGDYDRAHPVPGSPNDPSVWMGELFKSMSLYDLLQKSGDTDADVERMRRGGGASSEGGGYLRRFSTWLGRQMGYEPDGAGGLVRGRAIRNPAAAQESYDFWVGKGLKPHEAAGMAAQEIAESGGDPNARGDYVNGVPTAHGAYQWHRDRRAKILAATGIDVSNATIQQQREAAHWEYVNREHLARWKVQASRDAREAGAAATEFERPDPNRRAIIDAERGADAARILANAQKRASAAPGAGYRTLTEDETSLVPSAGLKAAGPRVQAPQDNSTSVQIDKIELHTQATDATGISKEIHKSLTDAITTQSNTGLQ